MPRVLHIITGLSTGGAETALFRLIVSSQGGRYRHEVVSLTRQGIMQQSFRDAGIEVTAFDFKRSPLREFARLVSMLRQSPPEIVQTWMYHADLLGGLAARLAGIPNIIWGIRTTSAPAGSRAIPVIRKLSALVSRWMPHTIVCVAEAARSAHVMVGYDAKRMVVIHNGFDMTFLTASLDEREARRALYGWDDSHIVIGTSGRFDLDKDHYNFVRAAGSLAAEHPEVRFLMVGSGLAPNNEKLARWIANTGFADRFCLLGQRSDAIACIADMDIFCLSSRNEGFPNVVGEAMALGVPCVVTDVGDSAVLVGDAGVVVPKEDPAALAAGMAQLVTQTPEGRRLMAERAAVRVRQRFTMQRVREQFELIYELVQEGESKCVA